MKKLVAVVVVGLMLVPLMASPALAWRGGGWHGRGGCCWGGFGVGVGIGVLATAPFWYPRYAYPAYAYPAYPYPTYGYPAYGYPAYSYPAYPVYPAPVPPPPPAQPADPGAAVQPGQSTNMTPGTPVSNPPADADAAPDAGQNCATVTVDGHNETRTLANGQTVTAWVPTSTQQVCQ
jgi:hypothetical protein